MEDPINARVDPRFGMYPVCATFESCGPFRSLRTLSILERLNRANELAPLRILLVGLPLMLLDIIADAVTGQADMELNGSFDTCDGLLSAAPVPKADVLIVSMKLETLSAACRDLLYVYPKARFLAITDDGKGAFLYSLRPHRLPVGELTLNDLFAAIRGDMPNTSGEWNEVTAEIDSGLKPADLAAMKRSEG